MKQAQWAIASCARIGQLYADFVGQLYTAEIPKDLKEQDEWGNRPREIFCDALVDKAEPIENKAVEGFETCLKAATDYSWYNEWSRLCERELNQMKPTEYPLSSEIKPEAGYVSTTMSPTPVITELSESASAAAASAQLERQVRTRVMAIQMKHKTGRAFDARTPSASLGLTRPDAGVLDARLRQLAAAEGEERRQRRARRPARWAARPTEHDDQQGGRRRAHPQGEEARHQRRPARRLREGDAALRRRPRSRAASRAASARSVSDAFKSRRRRATRACSRRASTRAPCSPSAAARTTPQRIWEGMPSTARRITNLGYVAWKHGEHGRAPSRTVQRGDRGRSAPHRRGAQQPGADPARQGARTPRAATRRSSTSRRRSATCARCWRSTATTCRRSRRWRSSTTT